MGKGAEKIISLVEEALLHRGFSEGETSQIIGRLIKYGEAAGEHVSEGEDQQWTIMPWGKHKGVSLNEIPTSYLYWLRGQVWFRDEHEGLYEEVLEVLARRRRQL